MKITIKTIDIVFKCFFIVVVLGFLLLIGDYVNTLYKLVNSPEYETRRIEYIEKKAELLNWYINQDVIPAGEFLMEVRNKYGERMSDSLRLEVWNHHRAVIRPIYDELMKQIP